MFKLLDKSRISVFFHEFQLANFKKDRHLTNSRLQKYSRIFRYVGEKKNNKKQTKRRIILHYTIKKVQLNISTGHYSSAPVIIKRTQTTNYIHWANKAHTSWTRINRTYHLNYNLFRKQDWPDSDSTNFSLKKSPIPSWLQITHKYRGSQQFSRVEYSTQIY